MKELIFIPFFISFSAQSTSMLDILNNQDSFSALQKELRNNIGSLFSVSDRPHDFIRAFESQDFESTLNLWFKSIQNTSFAASSTGSALYSYILFKNGFEVLSLKNLLEKSKPKEIHPIVSKLWKMDIDTKHLVWNHYFFPIDQKWHGFFSAETVFQMGSKVPLRLQRDQKYIKFLLSLPLDKKTDVFLLEWSFVLSLIHQDDMDTAAKILAWLIKKVKDPNQKDMIHLTIGRLLANIGEISASLHYYAQVQQLSYFWLLAQEEMAWILLDQKNYNKAYSTASVFEYLQFKKEISPYMFFVLALSQLKNCDYQGVVRSLVHFKVVFSERRVQINKILKSGSYKELTGQLSVFYNSGHLYYEVGKSDLPYFLKKDNFLRNHILLDNYIQNRKSTRQSKNKLLNKAENMISNQLQAKIEKRIQVLLQQEAKKIDFVLNHFQIIEAESLYRIHGFHFLAPVKRSKPIHQVGHTFISLLKPNGILYFPFDPHEIWLDELSDYESHLLKNCPRGSYVL